MSDPDSDRPPAETDGEPEDFQDDALSELMTGAFAATSMVSMSVPEELPELPEWKPAEPPPSAEVLDQVSGVPTHIHSSEIPLLSEFEEALAKAEAGVEEARAEEARAEEARAEEARIEAARAEEARAAEAVEAARAEEARAAEAVEAARVEAARVEAARVEAARAEEARAVEAARVEAARAEEARAVEAARVEAARAEEARAAEARAEEARAAEARVEAARAEEARVEAARAEEARAAEAGIEDGHAAAARAAEARAAEAFIEDEEVSVDFDSEPFSEEAEPQASISHESGVVVRPRRAPSEFTGAYEAVPRATSATPMHEAAMPVAVARSVQSRGGGGRGLMIGLGVVVVVAVIGGLAAAFLMPAEPDVPAIVSTAEPASEDAKSPSAEPVDPARDEISPPTKRADPPADADVLRASYAAAAKRYEANEDNGALLEMTVTACALRDGPTARSAFHKLVGAKARSKAVISCREHEIDVSADVEGFTAAELSSQAQTALDDGRLEDALELAKKSNRTERNQAALVLIVQINCRLGANDKAQKMLRHVSEKRRPALADYCHEVGVDLEP